MLFQNYARNVLQNSVTVRWENCTAAFNYNCSTLMTIAFDAWKYLVMYNFITIQMKNCKALMYIPYSAKLIYYKSHNHSEVISRILFD